MGTQRDRHSDGEPEDLPSDFFDDFVKDDFINGLSVIDSWGDNDMCKVSTAKLDSVSDLRELIDEGSRKSNKVSSIRDKFNNDDPKRDSSSKNVLDDYIKPGSRRDPGKTHEAIKKDKEVKVKEYLAKHLESSDDLRPPGTELDDYYIDKMKRERKKTPILIDNFRSRPYRRSRERIRRESPPWGIRSPRRRQRSPFRPPRNGSPPRKFKRQSPHWIPQHQQGPRRFSPSRRSSPFHRHSPLRRHSPLNLNSSHRSPPYRRSRSPIVNRRSYEHHHSKSPIPQERNPFLYPKQPSAPQPEPYSSMGMNFPPRPSFSNDYPGSVPRYSYPQYPTYGEYGPPRFEYGPGMQEPQPQPVPAPVIEPLHQAITSIPEMVPPPMQVAAPSTMHPTDVVKPYDALAQLVAEGKISKEDYLKLAPNKGMNSTLDPMTRVTVINRCNEALQKLAKLLLPTRILMNSNIIGQEPKCLAPKFCSPLKRQIAVDFQFTKTTDFSAQLNKQLIDSIIASIGLDKVVSRAKKNSKNMKDAAVQTTRPFCDVCAIRELMTSNDVSTHIDPENFSCSIHTQVIEQDLISSKSIFNPTGSISDSSPISIAHMTPAQLVSQLAARAKTLKQTPDPAESSNQFGWRHAPNNYDNRGQYHNYNNYRY